ncbi:MAG: hypothetical protein HOI95_13190 [Chromatiales bacterium]|nr:hypothetical protein [Chromatiales bacterium]
MKLSTMGFRLIAMKRDGVTSRLSRSAQTLTHVFPGVAGALDALPSPDFVVDSEAALAYLVNLGIIPLHTWSARVSSLEKPDWCILDLDPMETPFSVVVKVARTIYNLCHALGLPSAVKTSGSTGLHVLVPLGGTLTHALSRTLAELLGRVVVMDHPDWATVSRAVSHRVGTVYIDCGQNGQGRILAAPFCARPVPGARVSMPFKWTEVTQRLDIGRFTIKTAMQRKDCHATDAAAHLRSRCFSSDRAA